jgi:hypothetical protein
VAKEVVVDEAGSAPTQAGYGFLRCSWYLMAMKAINANAKAIRIVTENHVMGYSFGWMK